MTKESDVLTLRGDRNLWIDFVAEVKKQKKTVWEVLEQFIRKFLKKP